MKKPATVYQKTAALATVLFIAPALLGAQCVVYLRDNAEIRRQGWTRQIVLRHEIGHCNGWPGDHRGMRSIVV